ncbi:MAG TPA: SRPBCC family protein [Pyrinomonadaceae bacterium]|nr:SRPBCC family protein [Pyrinomonadaceae bacterium]
MATPRQEQGNGDGGDEGANGGLRGGLMNVSPEQLARGLGWFSLGLGLAEVLAPRGVGRLAGVHGNTGLIRLLGLREIAHGIGIFSQGRRPAGALWARVVGDAIDLACLGGAFASPRTNKGRLAFAAANVLTVTALDVLCAQQLGEGREGAAAGTVRAQKSLVINRSAEELYQYWHDFENLPRFMRHLESVQVTGEGRSRWVAKGPAGTSVRWDAQVTEDRPGEIISWRSLEGSEVDNAGSVRFTRAPGGRGTIVRVELEYTPPGGVFGAAFAKLFGEEPQQQVDGDLRRFKQLMETGEVVLSDATHQGTGLTDQRPGQPAAEEV